MEKVAAVYVDRGLLFSHEKEGNPAISDNTHRHAGITLSEIIWAEKNEYCMT